MASDSFKLPVKYMAKDGQLRSSKSVSSVSTEGNAGIKVAIAHQLASLQGVYYPPTACYDYYYPGFELAQSPFAQPDNKGNFNTSGGSGSYTGIANPSLLYYLPACLTGQAYALPGYVQQPCAYGLAPFPCYSFDSTHFIRSMTCLNASGKPNGVNTAKTCGNLYSNQSVIPQNKSTMRYGPLHYPSSSTVWNSNWPRQNRGRIGEIKSRTELTCGPRVDNRSNNSSKLLRFEVASMIKRYEYNSKKFRIEYDSAKFFVIKSYTEDDIHKSIKHGVWSSTTNGNKKLDAAFHEADAKTSETGAECPVFLFFSVNGSGQFVGVAEMIGPVDPSRNMNFWQLDKWNGFFPVKWHIIKDVPNALLRRINLENNESRPVTNSRDTQEIGLKQGLEMLSIFKNYSEKTSILYDFDFYEHLEKALKTKMNTKATDRNNLDE